MCEALALRSAQPFQRVSRSLRIGGHSTSIQLEAAFWEVLDGMAARRGLSTPKLVAALHEQSVELHGGAVSVASTLRTICLLYQGGRSCGTASG